MPTTRLRMEPDQLREFAQGLLKLRVTDVIIALPASMIVYVIAGKQWCFVTLDQKKTSRSHEFRDAACKNVCIAGSCRRAGSWLLCGNKAARTSIFRTRRVRKLLQASRSSCRFAFGAIAETGAVGCDIAAPWRNAAREANLPCVTLPCVTKPCVTMPCVTLPYVRSPHGLLARPPG